MVWSTMEFVAMSLQMVEILSQQAVVRAVLLAKCVWAMLASLILVRESLAKKGNSAAMDNACPLVGVSNVLQVTFVWMENVTLIVVLVCPVQKGRFALQIQDNVCLMVAKARLVLVERFARQASVCRSLVCL